MGEPMEMGLLRDKKTIYDAYSNLDDAKAAAKPPGLGGRGIRLGVGIC
jgi:hypothetical protein